MKYPQFNIMGLSDEQVDEIRDSLLRQTGFVGTRVDDHNTQFVVYERFEGDESRGLLLKVKTTAARFHFVANLWGCPKENGRLKLKACLEDKGADGWRFDDSRIELAVKNKRGNETKGNVFYFVPSDTCHCRNFAATDVHAYRDSLGRLAKSILDRLTAVDYFAVDYSGCRLAYEDDGFSDVADGAACEKDVMCEYQKMMQKNGGADPAMVLVAAEKWRQSDYDEDTKTLSELEPGVMSWVSTVEEVAKRAPIVIRGEKVRPATLRIPPYQRKFAWKEQNVRQLCKDLLHKESLDVADEDNYHLGTVILHHERKVGEEVWNVVDGQQRLTNIMAILGAPIFKLPIKQFTMRDYWMIERVMSEYSAAEQQRIRERLARCTLAFISVENVSEAFQLFTTQNGRGKSLTPVNLLKAYHYRAMETDRQRMSEEDFSELLQDTEQNWETANNASITTAPGDGRMLLHLFREYLFRLRQWSRGRFPQIPFGSGNIGEFKGVTIKRRDGLPLQNGAVLRTGAVRDGDYVAHRRLDDRTNPYVSICQTIVNGADFFKYAQSYVEAYKDVFCQGCVTEFHDFYLRNCSPREHRSGAAMYARHVFEALCMFCYDRFGADGLVKCETALFACAYFERVSQSRVLYRRCGSTYAPRAMEAMMTNCSVEDLQQALNELRAEVRAAVDEKGFVKGLNGKDKCTRGEKMQLAAYATIVG